MDANSKEARRQRKKKTFDDYVFENDVKMTRKKGYKPVEEIRITNKSSYYNKNEDSKATGEFPKPLLQSLHSGKKIKRRRKALYSTRRSDSCKMRMYNIEHSPDIKNEPFDSEQICPQSSGHSSSLKVKFLFNCTFILGKDSMLLLLFYFFKDDYVSSDFKPDKFGDRWKGDISSSCSPITITREDGKYCISLFFFII